MDRSSAYQRIRRTPGEIEQRIGRLASRQYGHVTHAQLIDLGVGEGAITYRLQTGRLIAVHTGVYAVGHRRTEPVALAAAAVLAGGPGALLSHFSAAALWGLLDRWPTPPEITVPLQRRPAGVRVHSSVALTRRDIRRQRGIRVTSPARTALDIAPRLTPPALARAVNNGRLRRCLRTDHLGEIVQRLPTHLGAGKLRPLAETRTGPTRSEFEDGFLAFVRCYALPEPLINTRVLGFMVDALFEAERVIVELDGWDYHSDRHSFEVDRERDATTLEAGYVTVRVTWERMTGTPDHEAARLSAILAARRPGQPPSSR